MQPLDTLLSFSNYNLQNAAFAAFTPHFRAAGVRQLASASPFSMGLLTPRPPPWHPAPQQIHTIVKRAAESCEAAELTGGLPSLALGFSLRRARGHAMDDVPSVVGLSNLREVHETMRVWREVSGQQDAAEDQARNVLEEEVRAMFAREGWDGWCWPSPPPEAL